MVKVLCLTTPTPIEPVDVEKVFRSKRTLWHIQKKN